VEPLTTSFSFAKETEEKISNAAIAIKIENFFIVDHPYNIKFQKLILKT
jgi:predicted metalloenzyme YecM